MKSFFLSLVAVFFLSTSTLTAQETDKNKLTDTITNTSQTLEITPNASTDSLQITEEIIESVDQNQQVISTTDETENSIIPSQGFSINSLWRGVLGMVTLVFVAFLFSSNRKAINWKIAGIGLALELLIAVGVLKVEFIKENLSFNGDDSAMSTLLLSVMGAFAEFERALILERQREGIAIAKKKGVYRGRKRVLSDEDIKIIKSKIIDGEKKAQLAREFGISRETLYQYLRKAK